jgi:hypothetical protein
MVWELDGRTPPIHFLIHDNDAKFTEAFDTIFRAAHVHVIHTPVRAPNANAYAMVGSQKTNSVSAAGLS